MKLWHRAGGRGGARRLVLIHGLGANADVWLSMQELLDTRWLAPDLRGHGRSPHQQPYGLATYAADVAELLEQDEEVDVVGHSLGGFVGMALGTGWFGVKVRKVLAFGVKTHWLPEEVRKLHELARTPARLFDTQEQAIERYLKVSGLFGLVDPSGAHARSGVKEENGKWRLVADPMTNSLGRPEIATFLRAMQCPLSLAAGSNDPIVNQAEMASIDKGAQLIKGAGHNAQVDKPAELWRWIQKELA